jgi:DNA-binding transcriptional ArsR family regulator
MMKPEDIPRYEERLILVDGHRRFLRHVAKGFPRTARGYSAIGDIGAIMREVWHYTLHGHACTPAQITQETGLPRTTVMRNLAYLEDQGEVTKDRYRRYEIDHKRLMRVAGDELDAAVTIVIEAAQQLMEIRKRRAKGLDQPGAINDHIGRCEAVTKQSYLAPSTGEQSKRKTPGA